MSMERVAASGQTRSVAATRLPCSNRSRARSYLCNGDAGDREQSADNQLGGHAVAKEQHARYQGEHRKQQAEGWTRAMEQRPISQNQSPNPTIPPMKMV